MFGFYKLESLGPARQHIPRYAYASCGNKIVREFDELIRVTRSYTIFSCYTREKLDQCHRRIRCHDVPTAKHANFFTCMLLYISTFFIQK